VQHRGERDNKREERVRDIWRGRRREIYTEREGGREREREREREGKRERERKREREKENGW
jgi:RNA-binding motif X-linked protein 2